MATLEDADNFLVGVENLVKEFKDKLDSKQQERVISSHVWMQDYLEQQIKNKVMPLKDALTTLKQQHVGDFKSSTQFDAVINYCTDIIKLLNEINSLYKMRANYIDLRMKWQFHLPQMTDKVKHMRNRFNIIKGQLSKKGYEPDEDW